MKINMPTHHKRFMDQMIETYTKSLTELFEDPKNRGPNYHPDKLPRMIIELSISASQLTLDNEWKQEYEDYISRQVKENK